MTKLISSNLLIKNFRRMWPYIKPYWFRAALGVALTVPVGALDGAVAMFLKPFMDKVMVDKQPHFSALIPFLIVGFTVVQGILIYSSNYLNTWVANKITIGVKRKLYEKLLSMDTSYFDKNNSGTILMRYSNDAETASTGLIDNTKQFLSKTFSSISLVCVLLYNSWQLALIAIGVLVFFIYPMAQVRRKMKEIMERTVGNLSYTMTIYNETFAGNKTIRSFTLEEEFKKRFKEVTDLRFSLAMKMVKGTNWLSPLMHIIMSIGIALVIGCGSYLIVSGRISSGNFVAFIAALMMLYTPLKSVGNNYINIQNSFLAIDRIFDILDLEPTIKDLSTAKDLQEVKKSISFEHVHFGYVPGREVLHDINLEIPVGSTLALVGNSGGGKTTISALLPRLYDIQKGSIKIDGSDIKDISQSSLRRQIAMVFQDNFLFSGTVKENILLGNGQASEETIWKALKSACLDEFVKGLPRKLDTEIGERGILLSGGQKQRLAIARAFVKNAPIVILDEATSALDNKSERVVQEALDNLMKNRTVIVIAHRLSTIQNADKIVVINDGKIAEQGTHEELLQQKGAYYALYAMQFKNKAA
ncbi:ABC transporter ATP-binding protein [Candidatus Avelusimicrobium faecicola]|uniref:ABC transporter ATP-binding protein n=1 Tax=Candidatus Avelusimicrobium faecicola TaxID=3416205 RepID=UPI003CC15844|nr:ABC transporter transmembrane domain-containing protein [Spirochaetota bacterium]